MKWIINFFRALFSLLIPARKTPKTRFETLSKDDIAWDIKPVPSRVIAVGDIHGDLASLGAILEDCALIDENGEWRGGTAHLVLLGDLIGGHEDSRLLLNFVIRLGAEASARGGAVHALLGNHDILPAQGDHRKFSRAERRRYKNYPIPFANGRRMKDAFRGNSSYAQWTRTRNAILRIGDTVFVHAGVERWALETDPGRVNATIRGWLRYWQGVGEKPGKRTRWTVGVPEMSRGSKHEIGPLWIRAFKPSGDGRPESGPSAKQLTKILEHYEAKRIVVGHAPVNDLEVVLAHPYYGDRVVMLDTRISDKQNGRLSALELKDGGCTALYTKRSRRSDRLITRELGELEATAVPPASLFARLKNFFGAK